MWPNPTTEMGVVIDYIAFWGHIILSTDFSATVIITKSCTSFNYAGCHRGIRVNNAAS
jgi:hypothetical protein